MHLRLHHRCAFPPVFLGDIQFCLVVGRDHRCCHSGVTTATILARDFADRMTKVSISFSQMFAHAQDTISLQFFIFNSPKSCFFQEPQQENLPNRLHVPLPNHGFSFSKPWKDFHGRTFISCFGPEVPAWSFTMPCGTCSPGCPEGGVEVGWVIRLGRKTCRNLHEIISTLRILGTSPFANIFFGGLFFRSQGFNSSKNVWGERSEVFIGSSFMYSVCLLEVAARSGPPVGVSLVWPQPLGDFGECFWPYYIKGLLGGTCLLFFGGNLNLKQILDNVG